MLYALKALNVKYFFHKMYKLAKRKKNIGYMRYKIYFRKKHVPQNSKS